MKSCRIDDDEKDDKDQHDTASPKECFRSPADSALQLLGHFTEVVVLVTDDPEQISQAGEVVLSVFAKVCKEFFVKFVCPATPANSLFCTALQRVEKASIYLQWENKRFAKTYLLPRL